MKILLVGDYPPPYGGIAVHVEQLHHFLRGQGIESAVLDIGKGGRPDPDVIPVRTAIHYAKGLFRFASRGWLLHLHVTGDNAKSWLVIASGVAAGWAFGLPAAITLHSGLLPQYLGASAARRMQARAALRGCGHVLAVSEQIRSALLDAGIGPSKISVNPAFCASQLQPGDPPHGFDAIRGDHQPLLAMANHPIPLYGRPLMLRALRLVAENHPRAGLALFGPSISTAELVAEARAEGVESRIRDFGELRHPAALGLIARCDAFVRPTTADGDSVSVREALALGVPCVASDVVARPLGAVLFRAGDALDLARRISESIANQARRVEPADVGPVLLDLYARLDGQHRHSCGRRRRGSQDPSSSAARPSLPGGR